MLLKPNSSWCWLTRYGTAIVASVLTLTTTAIAHSAPVVPFDEPPCFMRTKDGRVVNLESLCRRSTSTPTQTTPTNNRPPTAPQKTPLPQAMPNQVSRPSSVPTTSSSHAQGNPDSDDGRY